MVLSVERRNVFKFQNEMVRMGVVEMADRMFSQLDNAGGQLGDRVPPRTHCALVGCVCDQAVTLPPIARDRSI